MRIPIKLFFITVLILLLPVSVMGQGYRTHEWIRIWGNPIIEPDEEFSRADIRDMQIGPDGSLYVIGEFYGIVDFDPGQGEDFHDAVDDSIYLSKFDEYGNHLWTRSWGVTEWRGINVAMAPSLAVTNNSDIFVSGQYDRTWDFDPGPGIDKRSAVDDEGIFILRFNESGELTWLHTWPQIGTWSGLRIHADDVGGFYLTGRFWKKIDFDMGPGVHTEQFSPDNSPMAFLGRYDREGNLQWIRTWDNIYISDFAMGPLGNIFCSVSIQSSTDLDPGDQSYMYQLEGNYGPALLSLTPSGELVWAKFWTGGKYWVNCRVAADERGDVYLTTWFGDVIQFLNEDGDPLDLSFESEDGALIIIKFNANGEFQWARTSCEDPELEASPIDIAVFEDTICIGGWFNGRGDVDESENTLRLSSGESSAGFVFTYDSEGNLKWASILQTENYYEPVCSVNITQNGNIYVAGKFNRDCYIAMYSP